MRQQLREAWSKLITAEDYEAHMVAVGQAQANAALVCEYLQAHPPAPDSALLFAGAGTGQMFDFFSPETVLPFNVTFTEINAGYLNRLRTRLTRFPGLRYAIFVDDLERTALAKPFDLALPVLVLQHVDWHPAVLTLCALTKRKLFLIIQENPLELATAMTANRTIPRTMRVFTQIHPALIPAAELKSEMRRVGLTESYAAQKLVADGKKMLAFGFCPT
jgi:hypothetical protein